ncbi:3-deoxy-D-arabino-heptulosonate 7-phosphate synthase [Achromobacter sp.]|uniref:3-deoxy-D-arabino-heptulosonate 7-phosphate synthase n=1 Tax=Achromobacter sp. TaxID=134375 RepID=UPI0028A91351|nr:3-deoxy-D-arabino-heptulosonate 7-phosphate synthase [Achromobacter sp.]
MPPSPTPALLDQILHAVARRFRVPPLPAWTLGLEESDPSTALAIIIEEARQALAGGTPPEPALQWRFCKALAQLIREAMRDSRGDPVFQAMVLRHRAPRVREHASLYAHADRDRRAVRTAVDAMAHPGKLRNMPVGALREALAQLYGAAASGAWTTLADDAARILATPEQAQDPAIAAGLAKLLDEQALAHLRRLDELAADPLVQRYQTLWDKQGPRPGTPEAAAQGLRSHRRGVAVEALAEQAMTALAQRLAHATGDSWRVAASLRVPASIPGETERAKTEWDVALLHRPHDADTGNDWDVRLLVEAKASTDAANTDLPRLIRGLRLLANADPHTVHTFKSRQGPLRLRGASLRALDTDEAALDRSVLYFSDAPADARPRLLGAAGRMQLLSAPASLDFAGRMTDGQSPAPQLLEPVWRELLESPRWSAVLNQYPLLRRVRSLMVHADDLMAAIQGMERAP